MNISFEGDLPLPVNVSRESLNRLRIYVDLLLSWQQRINLIGPSTLSDVWNRHVSDALQLLPLLGDRPLKIADLGSGAGLPGLVLAIAGGHTVHLYESNGKKAAFLRQAIRATQAPAHVHQTRIEMIGKERDVPAVDVVTARALAPLTHLLELAEPFLALGAWGLFHKGQDVDSELTAATRCWRIQFKRHASLTDSRGVILEVRDVSRV